MTTKHQKTQVTVSLVPKLMAEMLDLAEDREMTVDSLVAELVQLGLLSLRSAPPVLEDFVGTRREAGHYVCKAPKR